MATAKDTGGIDAAFSPCPFAATHTSAYGFDLIGDDNNGWQVFCCDCQALGPWAATRPASIALWNGPP